MPPSSVPPELGPCSFKHGLPQFGSARRSGANVGGILPDDNLRAAEQPASNALSDCHIFARYITHDVSLILLPSRSNRNAATTTDTDRAM